MHAANLNESTPGPDVKRKHGRASRGSSRRVREVLFFHLLTEQDARGTEDSASAIAAVMSGMVPAWLSVSLGS